MEESAKKDRKIKDKKISVKASTCYHITGICFLLTGILSAWMGDTPSSGLTFVPIGLLFTILGTDVAKKEKKQDGDSEDENSISDCENL